MKLNSLKKVTWPQLAVVVGGILALGGLVAYRLLAADFVVPTGAQDVVLEYEGGHGMLPTAGDKIPDPDATSFRLYGDGTAVCGKSPYNTSLALPNQSVQYVTKKLSGDEINILVNQVIKTGFLDLKADYTRTPNVTSEAQNTIGLTLNDSGLSEVSVDPTATNKPAAFTKTTQILQKLCTTFSAPYTSDQTTIRTKEIVVTPSLRSTPIDENTLPSVQLPATRTDVKNYSLNGNTSKNLSSSLKHQSSSIVQANNKTYQVVINQVLPKPAKPKKVRQQSRIHKNVAYAAGMPPVRYAVFCAVDACTDTNTKAYGDSAHIWYIQQVGKTYDEDPNYTQIHGSHTAAYYNTCHTAPCNTDSLGNVLQNIKNEFGQQPRQTTELILGWSSGVRYACGWGDMTAGNPPNIAAPAPGWAISDFSDPGNGLSCSYNGYSYVTFVHELGHNFNLTHTVGDHTIMDPGSSCPWPNCSLNANQAAALRAYSPFFHPFPQVIGHLDTASCTTINGWAMNTGTPNTNMTVHLYFTTSVHGQTGYNYGATDKVRTDVNAVYGGNGRHGFSYPVPALYKGQNFIVVIYAIDAAFNNPPIGYQYVAGCGLRGLVDSNTCTKMVGWVYNQYNPSNSAKVRIYLMNLDGSGQETHDITADIYRPAVNSTYGISGSHGFGYTIPAKWKKIPHIARAYGLGLSNNNAYLGGGAISCQ